MYVSFIEMIYAFVLFSQVNHIAPRTVHLRVSRPQFSA